MRISYTPEQEELRRELRSYFTTLMTPERREALSSTQGEVGTGNAYRDVVVADGQRRVAHPELAQRVRRPGSLPDGLADLHR